MRFGRAPWELHVLIPGLRDRPSKPGSISIAELLSGGDARALGRVPEVIDIALCDSARLRGVLECLSSDDLIVRMRASDALEKVARQRPELLEPFVEPLLGEVAAIEQPSVQWRHAQIFSGVRLDTDQRRRAVEILKRNFERSEDWIVLSLTMDSLTHFALEDPDLRRWLVPELRRHLDDRRKSVSKHVLKLLKQLGAPG